MGHPKSGGAHVQQAGGALTQGRCPTYAKPCSGRLLSFQSLCGSSTAGDSFGGFGQNAGAEKENTNGRYSSLESDYKRCKALHV